ncbi:predicted protein [Nematostella vectensis]|uniref:3-beta hydroxysteroid dehydrogenase/isomerase domain-containing protein n=1 Tax=Nematostella vectensis TaxID=45351 RepID=A7RJW6_NEMVE|nr:predicted protein [Nematostella vectensis]|eukprot:XP_001640408.1 predicted protein [Nematostella vectensis]
MSEKERKCYEGKKVVVTGGAGYFGSRLGYALSEKGAEVTLFDIREPRHSKGLTFVKGDVSNKEHVRAVVKGADYVFHSASYGMSGREQLNKELIEKVNIQGTQNIIEACIQLSVAHLVYTSTYNVIFGSNEIHEGDEALPYLPLDEHTDHYSKTKSISEQNVLKANKTNLPSKSGRCGDYLRTCALRPAGIYGEGEERHLPRIVNYIEKGLFSFTYGRGESKVDFVHVDNLVLAHVGAGSALTGKAPLAAGEAYFISDGRPINNFEFFKPLVEGLGYKYPTLRLPFVLVYVLAYLTEIIHSVVGRYIYNFQPLLTRTEVHKTGVTHYFSIAKARSHFQYTPKVHDLSGVVKHFREQGRGRRLRKAGSGLWYHVVNVIIGLFFASLLFSFLPTIETIPVFGFPSTVI